MIDKDVCCFGYMRQLKIWTGDAAIHFKPKLHLFNLYLIFSSWKNDKKCYCCELKVLIFRGNAHTKGSVQLSTHVETQRIKLGFL